MSAKGNRNDRNRTRYLADQAKRIQGHPGTYKLGYGASTDGSSEPEMPPLSGETTGFPGVYYERQKK